MGRECYFAEFHRNLSTWQWHVSEHLCSICVPSFTHCSCSLFCFSSLIWGTVYIKDPPAKEKTWVRSLGQEDLLEKGMATHPSILAWRIPWTEEPGGLQSMGSQIAGHDWASINNSRIRCRTSFAYSADGFFGGQLYGDLHAKNWKEYVIVRLILFYSIILKQKTKKVRSEYSKILNGGPWIFLSDCFS